MADEDLRAEIERLRAENEQCEFSARMRSMSVQE